MRAFTPILPLALGWRLCQWVTQPQVPQRTMRSDLSPQMYSWVAPGAAVPFDIVPTITNCK